jgi:2-oxoacid:acceptor oxidoreductase delta subunit (pyruvate/2-ketoisovalerate family)
MWYNKTGSWRNVRPVIDLEKCTRCLLCWKFCPDLSIIVDEEKNTVAVDYDYCKGCGICAEECNVGAITMEEEK